MTSRFCLGALLALTLGTTLNAQRSVRAQISVGGVAFLGLHESPWLGGWYADAMQSFAPGTAVVAETSGFYGPERAPLGTQRWFAVLGGLRQRVVRRTGANVSAQLLVGLGRWSQRHSDLPSFVNAKSLLTFQPGVNIDIPLDPRWSVRGRADLRTAFGFDGESVERGRSVAFGVTRYWGRR